MKKNPSSIGRRSFIKSAAIGGGTILGGIAATNVAAAYDDISWPQPDSNFTFHDGVNMRYRSISKMNLDYYIEWNSSGHFQHKPIINTVHEANHQSGRHHRGGGPSYTTEGWIGESRLNIETISNGWRLSDRENNYLECCPGIAGENDSNPNEFFNWSVGFLAGSTPGISTLKDIFEGGNALAQTLYDEKEDGYTTTYKWDYDKNSGQLRDGESYPYTDSQSFQPAEEVDHSPNSSNRPAEAVFQTTWDHIGGGGAPDAPVAGFDIEVPTPNKRFDEMSSSEKDKWGVKPAGDSRFPLTGTDDDDLIATDPPADITYLSE